MDTEHPDLIDTDGSVFKMDPATQRYTRERRAGEGFQVGIPWRPSASRIPAMTETVKWYESHGFEVKFADTGSERFNLAATRNLLIRSVLDTSDGRPVVLSDADTVPEIIPLMHALYEAPVDRLVHLPYHLYRDTAGAYTPGARSGVYVTTRDAWDSTNGQDELFEGWGFEDAAWELAHLTLNGPIVRHHGFATAAVHQLAPRDRVAENRARYSLYIQAYGLPEAMRRLIAGESPVGHGARTAARRATIERQRITRYTRPLGR